MPVASGLLVVWLLSTLFIATLTFEFRRVRFNFNVFFVTVSSDLLLRFSADQYSGFPF